MIKDYEDSILFSNSEEFEKRTPFQNLLLEIMENVNNRILHFYLKECPNSNIKTPDMLIMVTANVFANLCHNIMLTPDTAIRLKIFESMNESLLELNRKIYMTLETYYADGKTKN